MSARPDFNDPAQRPSRPCGRPITNILGQRFGSLVVIREAARIGRNMRWHCQCDCGTTKIIRGTSLLDGTTWSCGCLRRVLSQRPNSERARSAAVQRDKRSKGGAATTVRRVTLDDAWRDAQASAAAKLAGVRVRFDQEEAA